MLVTAALIATPLHAADVRETQLEQQMWVLLNNDRAANGLPALRFDAQLATVARAHSLDMARSGFFSHTSPNTGDPQSRLARAGVPWSAYAENISLNSTVERSQKSLMASPGHRSNILSPSYDTVGIGIVRNGRQIMVTQVFTRSASGSVARRGQPRRGARRTFRSPFGF